MGGMRSARGGTACMGIASRLAVVGATVLSAVSCQPDTRAASDRATDSGAGAAAAANAQPAAGQYSVQDFARLRWLEGSWRGQLPDRSYFYERYRFLNDSTISMYGFPDSTFARATDSAMITLRGGTITDVGASAHWVATRLDSSVVEFTPVQPTSAPFSWARESANRWTATLRSRNPAQSQTTVYRMERAGR
jgi:hypothetical protein